MIDYKSLAKTAAVNFIKKNIPLNDSITKLAKNFNLNPSQIQRVSELSNKATHQYCILKVADKNFTFELADSSKIINDIDSCSCDSGILNAFEPEKVAADSGKLDELFNFPESQFDVKSANRINDINKLAEKIDAAIKESESRITFLEIEKMAEIQDLKTQINHLQINGIQPEDIRQTLCKADPNNSEAINKAMQSVTGNVISGTLSDPAEKAPVINQKHPVVITIKNIMAKDETIGSTANAKEYLINQKKKLEDAIK